MIVLHESIDSQGKRQLNCLLGPCWPFMFLLTLPLIVGVVSTFYSLMWWRASAIGKFFFVSSAMLTLGCLLCTSFRDPGILPRHHQPPPGENEAEWLYSDQAQTYRPKGAMYCDEAEVVFEGFDHVCPWTGTAIAKKNLCYFYSFIASIVLFITAVAVA